MLSESGILVVEVFTMTQFIQTVFGSQNLLASLIKKTPEPSFLLKPSSPQQVNMLLDLSGKGKFSAPVRFTVNQETGTVKIGEFIQCMYFYITEDEEAVFTSQMDKLFNSSEIYPGLGCMILARAKTDRIQYLLLSSWEHSTDFFAMKETPAFTPLRQFTTRAANSGGYHEIGYKVLAPHEYLD